MNKVLMSLLVGCFVLTSSAFAQTQTPPAPAPAPAVTPGERPAHHEHGEHHPEMHRALRKLRGAKQDLAKALHDYGGHRAKAMAAVDHAIEEINAALEYANKK